VGEELARSEVGIFDFRFAIVDWARRRNWVVQIYSIGWTN
jgi:hypothetical protein